MKAIKLIYNIYSTFVRKYFDIYLKSVNNLFQSFQTNNNHFNVF